MVAFKPYTARMFISLGLGVEELERDIDDCTYYLRTAPKPTNWLTPQADYLAHLRGRVESILIVSTKIAFISNKDFVRGISKVRNYSRKELLLAKAKMQQRVFTLVSCDGHK